VGRRSGAPYFFVHGVARVKSIEVEWDIDREPFAFCNEKNTLAHWPCVCSGVGPLRQLGMCS
jgi:hypothetical protein